MRDGDTAAWTEFGDRFRPMLLTAAEKCGVPSGDVDECVTEVLDDLAMRFAVDGEALPRNLTGYLLRTVRFRNRTRQRAAVRRARWIRAAASERQDVGSAERVIASICSADLLRSVESPDEREFAEPPPANAVAERCSTPLARPRTAVERWVALLTRELTDLEWQLLGWVAEQVPRREMAAWLGAEYEATKRRVTRLVTRVRARALERAGELSPTDRAEVAAWLRRAGIAAAAATPDESEQEIARTPDGTEVGGSSDDA